MTVFDPLNRAEKALTPALSSFSEEREKIAVRLSSCAKLQVCVETHIYRFVAGVKVVFISAMGDRGEALGAEDDERGIAIRSVRTESGAESGS